MDAAAAADDEKFMVHTLHSYWELPGSMVGDAVLGHDRRLPNASSLEKFLLYLSDSIASGGHDALTVKRRLRDVPVGEIRHEIAALASEFFGATEIQSGAMR